MGSAPSHAAHANLDLLARVQLERSRERYRLATARFQGVLSGYQNTPLPSLERTLMLKRALAEERAAREEFIKALGFFSDLVLHRKEPEQG